jgi:hypothetical protein
MLGGTEKQFSITLRRLAVLRWKRLVGRENEGGKARKTYPKSA